MDPLRSAKRQTSLPLCHTLRYALRMTGEDPSPLQANIRRLREAREWDRTELARKAKVSLPYVSQLESGARRNPRITTLRKIARALGTTVASLQAPSVDEDTTDVAAAS